MLRQRVITAAIGVPLLLIVIWWGGPGFAVVVGAALAVACLEFASAAAHSGRQVLWQVACPAVAGLTAAAYFGLPWLTGAFTAFLLASLAANLRRHDHPEALADWLWTAGGVVYIGWLGSHAVLLRRLPEDGLDWVLLAIFATFATDTAAYFVGRAVGSHHLAAAISPGKTVEGAVGGLVGGLAAVLVINYATGLREPVGWMVPLGVVLPLAAIAGDLVESQVKRATGIKDAGVLIPGHGGLLDRMDSLLFVVAVVYYYAIWVL